MTSPSSTGRRAGAAMRPESSGEQDPAWALEHARPPGRMRARHGRGRGEPRWNGARPAPDPRVSLRALRPGRTPAGILAALLLSVAGWAATADLIWVMLGGRPRWGTLDRLGALGARTWDDPLACAIAYLMIVCGVALLAHAIIPGRPRLIPLETSDPLLALGLTRSGLRRTLATAIRSVDGVDGVQVALRNCRIEITVRAAARRTGDLLPRVGAAAGHTLIRLGADHNRQVVVRLRPGRR
ncbi:DUF6286 domain-containing protein [Thermopolyspora sp. NPDC052614]|uniref:DUF6286 domain-containing protein n=1 Tax=Thermopolyspora sp. NPDC052614 TaxID=3155682 RepID=UPI00343F4CFB